MLSSEEIGKKTRLTMTESKIEKRKSEQKMKYESVNMAQPYGEIGKVKDVSNMSKQTCASNTSKSIILKLRESELEELLYSAFKKGYKEGFVRGNGITMDEILDELEIFVQDSRRDRNLIKTKEDGENDFEDVSWSKSVDDLVKRFKLRHLENED